MPVRRRREAWAAPREVRRSRRTMTTASQRRAIIAERNLPLHRRAEDLTYVKPEYQLLVVREMERANDFGPALARTLILRAPESERSDLGRRKNPWKEGEAKKEALVAKLAEAERRHDFYAGLYRQYVADLLKLCVYVRSLVTNPAVGAVLRERHPKVLAQFEKILFETEGSDKP